MFLKTCSLLFQVIHLFSSNENLFMPNPEGLSCQNKRRQLSAKRKRIKKLTLRRRSSGVCLCRSILFAMAMTALVSKAQAQGGFQIVEKPAEKQVNVLYKGKLLTAFCYYDSIRKPILFPVNTVGGITVTRGYPIAPRPGERTDHPHHTGLWMNYESVNGLDFWNNSTAIPVEKRNGYGTIKFQKILGKKVAGNTATLVTSSVWVRPDDKVLLNETTTFDFKVEGNDFIIDRKSILTATDTTVLFKDAKDGMVAMRVARELEQPSKEASSFVDDKGNVTKVAPSGNDVTGLYYSSTGLRGDSVWSSQGPWVMLTGKKDGKDITIAIIDHPQNAGYPTYWHARGYGLFAANPLGRKIFSNGKEELNYSLQPGAAATFQYRIIIHEGKALDSEEMKRLAEDFGKKQ